MPRFPMAILKKMNAGTVQHNRNRMEELSLLCFHNPKEKAPEGLTKNIRGKNIASSRLRFIGKSDMGGDCP